MSPVASEGAVFQRQFLTFVCGGPLFDSYNACNCEVKFGLSRGDTCQQGTSPNPVSVKRVEAVG